MINIVKLASEMYPGKAKMRQKKVRPTFNIYILLAYEFSKYTMIKLSAFLIFLKSTLY